MPSAFRRCVCYPAAPAAHVRRGGAAARCLMSAISPNTTPQKKRQAEGVTLLYQNNRRQLRNVMPLATAMIITALIIRPAINAASNTAMMAMMNTAIIMGMAIMTMINTAIIIGRANTIIGTAIMAASNAAIMAAIICLLDDAGLFDFERIDHAGKRRSICSRDRNPPAIAIAKQTVISVNNCLMLLFLLGCNLFYIVPEPAALQTRTRFATTYFFNTQAFVASSHFISFVFSQSAFVFGASAANAGAVTATKGRRP